MLDTNLEGGHPRNIPPNLDAIGPVVSEEKIKMCNVDGRTKSDDNSSHGLKAR
jgi:hypothetical protein